jgi:hypothetical protein
MAIIKSKTLANGATGDYWKITSVNLKRSTLILSIKISLYQSKSKSMEKAPDLGLSKHIKVKISREESIGNLVELAYTKVMEDATIQISSKLFDPTATKQERESAPTVDKDTDLAGGVSG